MKITMEGKYKTRGGQPVRILCVDSGIPSYPVVGIIAGRIATWTEIGAYAVNGVMDEQDLLEHAELPLLVAARKVVAAWYSGTDNDLKRMYVGILELERIINEQ